MCTVVSICGMMRPQLMKTLHRQLHTRINKELPRITLPRKLKVQFEKKERKQLEKKAQKAKTKMVHMRSPLVISCKRPEYNHHKGQTYSEFNPKILASHGWHNHKSVGDYFTINAYTENPALQDPEKYMKRFEDFDLNEKLLQKIQDLDLEYPTMIQRLTIGKMLQGHNIVCAAETGSGKTLAYLLPILEIIQRINSSEDSDFCPNSPRAIIVVPSRELANQVMKVAELFTDACDVRVKLLSTKGITRQNVRYFGEENIDVVVSTPGTLIQFLKSGKLKKSRCQHLIFDEADTLLDDSFSGDIGNIMKRLNIVISTEPSGDTKFVSSGTQVVLVSATMPRNVEDIFREFVEVDSFVKLTTQNLHHIMPHVPQTFMRLKTTHKVEEIIRMSKESLNKRIPTMVFCNRSDTCFWLHKLLREHGVSNIVLNAQMDGKLRLHRFENFQDEVQDVFVCTDICSRGLDTLRVKQVINYDFPQFISDYIHRAGRVGRVGAKESGKVISFVTHKWDVQLLWEIETAARKSKELSNVNANIKQKINRIVLRKFSKPSQAV